MFDFLNDIFGGDGLSGLWDTVSGLWSGSGIDEEGSMGLIGDIFSIPGISSGLGTIGGEMIRNEAGQDTLDYYRERDALNAAISREELAARERIAGAQAGAAVAAAKIAAGSANKRAKMAALMDAAGKRVDSMFTGTGQQLSVIRDMIGAVPRRR